MANVTITQLPAAGPIQGDELVPIVQNGQTVRSTTAAVAGSPVQTQTFITLNQEPTLNNSRALAGGTGVGLVDNGAQSTLQVTLNGASGSLESAGNGVIVKTGASTVTNRSVAVSGTGLAITNGDGVSGNPTVALDGLISAVAQVGGTGLLAIQNGTTAGGVLIAGTAGEINVANGNGQGGNPTISLANTTVVPGSYTTADITVDAQGRITAASNGSGGGSVVSSFSAGTTGLTPSVPTTGAVVLDGVLNVSNGGSGATSLTGYLVGNGTSPFSAISVIPNAGLQNDSVTYNGVTVALGSSGSITAASPQALTIGTGLSGGSYDGSSAVTVAIDSTVVTLTDTQTLTNKSISGATNTLSSIPNAALDNSSVTIGTTSVSLGGTSLTLGGLTSVAVTQDPVSALQVATKQYVDGLVSSGITYHAPVKYEVPNSTGNLNATYNQPGGPGVGVGATLTNAGTLASFAPDGPTASPGDRVLIYNQTNAFENGVYTVTVVGNGSTPWVLTRATDADTYGLKSPTSLGEGDAFFIQSGNTGAGETYICNTTGVITFGTTAITFVQVSSSQVYSAGTGLTLSGTQFSLSNTGTPGTYGSASQVPVITTNAQGQVTGVTNTSIAICGSAVSGNISGNAANVTGIVAVANGGTGTATPGLVAGCNVTITGTWPNQTISSTGACVCAGVTSFSAGTTGLTPVAVTTGAITLAGTLASSNGGTGLTTFGAADRALYSTSASALTAGTLPVVAGGTGQTSYTNGQLLIGNTTGNTLTKATLTAGTGICISNGAGSITISSTASVACATPTVAGKVFGKTDAAFTANNTALGYNAGTPSANAVAVGSSSFSAGCGSVAVGASSIASCTSAISVGAMASSLSHGVAMGAAAYAGAYAVSIGRYASSISSAIAIGECASASYFNSISLGLLTSATGPNQTHIGPIRSVGSCTGPYQSLFYCSTTKEVIQGTAAGGGVCCATPTVAGIVYGKTETFCCAGGITSLGYSSNAGCAGGVAVGASSTAANYGVAVGKCANAGYGGVSVGINASNSGFGFAVAIGPCVSATGPCQTHISPIRSVCSTTGLQGLFYNACTKEVIRGTAAGGVCCATPTVAGKVYGKTEVNCTSRNTTLGFQANSTGANGTAIGFQATVFGNAGVAIGSGAYTCFGATGAVAVGYQANSVGSNGIAIGRGTSAGANGIAIGAFTSASAGSIVLNATGSAMSCVSPNRTYINPITYTPCSIGLNTLYYCNFTKEVFNGPAGGGGGVCCASPTVAGKVYGYTVNACSGGNTGLGYGINFTGPSVNSVVIGNSTTYNRYFANCNVVIGAGANACCCVNSSVAIGLNPYVAYGSANGVAIGTYATVAGTSVAIGNSALANCFGVAIGTNTLAYSGSIAIRGLVQSGATQSIAIGGTVCNFNYESTVVGFSSYSSGVGAIALGRGAQVYHCNSVVIGRCVVSAGACRTYIKPIRSASGPFTLRYNPCSGEITYS